MRCESGLWMSLWCRSKDVLISEIDTKHKQPTKSSDPKYVLTEVSIEDDWLYASFTYTEVSTGIWYVIAWIVHWSCNANDTGDRLRPDVFICDSLSSDQIRQSQTRSIMSQRHPVRPGLTYTPMSQMSPIITQCLDAIVLADIKLAAFIFCHVLISTLGWKW